MRTDGFPGDRAAGTAAVRLRVRIPINPLPYHTTLGHSHYLYTFEQ